MNEVFERTGNLTPDRNLFNLSHTFKADVDFGYLYPVMVKKVIPGDVIRMSLREVIRMNAGVAPFMHEVDVKFWTFFVPFRILDKDGEKGRFESVISGGLKGQEQRDFYRLKDLSPQAGDFTKFGVGSLSDYLGIIPPSAATVQDSTKNFISTAFSSAWTWIQNRVEAYPWLAYNSIYINYFADENLEDDKFTNPTTSLFDAGDYWIWHNLDIQFGNWEKDYFTSGLPFQQRGTAPALPVDITGTLPVDFSSIGLTDPPFGDTNIPVVAIRPGNIMAPAATSLTNFRQLNVNPTNPDISFKNGVAADGSDSNSYGLGVPGNSLRNTLSVDGANLVAQTFNVADLRVSVQIQKWMERNARAGVRYTEFLKSHFGVSPTDSRLDRPEYLGGTTGHLVVSEVLQTNATSDSGALGDLAGHGLSAMEDGDVISDYHVQEFGCVMVLMMIRPKPGYFQGIPREWMYGDRFDWPFPEFAHLSEQAIAESELYVDGSMTEGQADDLFAYQGRYDELRVAHDRIAGHMRDNLDYWHLARRFDEAPALNEDFIKINPLNDGLHRVFANQFVEIEGVKYPINPFECVVGFNLSVLRPLPFIAEPGLVDHF